MMNVKEAIRNNLMVELDKCLSSLIRYDVDSLMPLFYVLCAHHEGHLVSIVGEGKSLFHGKMHIQPIEIVDGYESPLLKEIRNSVNPSFFEGQSAEAVFQFYSMCNEYINEFYQDIIEHIISVYTSNAGKYSGVSVTTQEIAQLMGYFITDCAPRRVYDPCAGLCSFAILPELSKIEFVCSELSNRTKVIADIRLNAAGKQLEINQEDCTFNWRGNSINKIREMNPELANSLSPNIPSFTDLKWSDLFKNVSIAGDDDIPINKRGSGVKRLILLNFFRAEVERMQSNTESDGLIYAIEEPETSQHVAHQKILMKALIDLANNENVQVILTTHSSYIVKQLKFDNIRLIKEIDGRKVVQNVELSQLPYPSLNEINFTSFGEVTEEYHDELYSYLYSNKTDEVRWIEEYINGKPTVNYIRELQNGSTKEEQKTLTEKIRHQIHHPENCHNAPYTEADIRQSIEDMRTFIMNKRES